ncbi:hypothetical protein [Limnoglobus roseus]|uniref:Uncharacterized protein n=1 Tax=Limnoglobus roseus TaxID=2598579 RepID=A0A5C1AN72_9BACT|nr:hypothetical protein [Limnoglobus roseus]QEL20681.1 hypothetical protein PX52LOC_07788 [Limnoglobus roseus]
MDEDPPTPHARAVAQEALDRNPQLAGGRDPDEWVQILAGLYELIGDTRFRVRFGLRPPADEYERARLAFDAHQMTAEEFRPIYEVNAARPADLRMVETMAADLEQRVVAYAHFLQTLLDQSQDVLRGRRQWWDELVVGRVLRRVTRKLEMDRREVATLEAFLQEVRVERGLGLAGGGTFDAPAAMNLGINVTRTAENLWGRARAPERAVGDHLSVKGVYDLITRDGVPPARRVLALLHQEVAAARLVLRGRAAATPAPSVYVAAQNCTVTATTLTVSGPEFPPEPAKTPTPNAAFRVARWADLAIGIDAARAYWAATPVPALGDRVPTGKWAPLDLRGDRWRAVLDHAARSADGTTVDTAALLAALGVTAGQSSGGRDGRARPGEVEAARLATDGLRAIPSGARKSLTDTLADLRREIRALIGGPTDKAHTLFVVRKKTVCTGFVVRYLIPTDGGHVTFGSRPK